MNKEEVTELLEFLEISYPNFEIKEGMTDAWLNELQMYDCNDVKKNLARLMSDEYYQKTPPLVNMIIKNLTKVNEKIDYSKLVYFCPICRRKYNDKELLDEHFDRCSSVKYIVHQYERFKLGKVNKKELYEMAKDEFDTRYKKLLKKIQQLTTNENEKSVISFIFNPPRNENARQFLASKLQ